MSYTLFATGDLMLQRPIVRTDNEPTLNVFRMFASAGHTFANLEVTLADVGEATDKLVCLRAPPSLAIEVKRANLDVVSLANNHTMDFGVTGLRSTIAAVAGVGLSCVGAGEDLEDSLAPVVLQSGNLKIAFLGLACTLANGVGAGIGRPGLAPIRILTQFVVDPVLIQETPGVSPYVATGPMPGDTEQAIAAVARAKEIADLVVIGIHWGVPSGWVAENQGELATYQQPLGHSLIDAGADVVVGHHPHVLHGVELYRGHPIFYSLGNFLFHSLIGDNPVRNRPYPPYDWSSLRSETNRHGGIACVSWTCASTAPSDIQMVPVWLDKLGEPSFGPDEKAYNAIARVASLSRKFGTSVSAELGDYGPVARIS